MVEFIQANLYNIVTVVVFILLCFIGCKLGYTAKVKEVVLALVIKAETQFESGKGAEKKALVIKEIYECLPPIAKVFVTEQFVEDMIEQAVEKMKELLK